MGPEIKISKTVQEKLDEVIELKLDRLIKNEGVDQRNDLDELEKLYELKNEADKIQADMGESRKDRIVNTLTQIGVAVGGWLVYDIWHRRGLKFEETGMVNSQWTKNLMSKMFPRR